MVFGGLPRATSAGSQYTLLTNRAYVEGYSEARKDPVFGAYHLTGQPLGKTDKRPAKFSVDERTRDRVTTGDYTGSGFDRGHMAPNYAISVCYGQEAQLETFLMSNIIPQRPRLNRGIWKNLEQIEIRKYAQELEEIWVLDGGIFEGNEHLHSGVNVPSACYKIIVDEQNGKPRVLAFIIGQNIEGTEDFTNFLTSVNSIEHKTALDFLSDLPDDIKKRVEAQVARCLW